jgi:hypothetical protein
VHGRSLLDEIAREGARRLLMAALETEVAAYLEAHREERDAERHALVVRPPVVAVGDGALGFWAAVRDVWPKTHEQRDWFHKLGNISTSARSASSRA